MPRIRCLSNSDVVRGLEGPSPQLHNLVSSFPKVSKATLFRMASLDSTNVVNNVALLTLGKLDTRLCNWGLPWDVKNLKSFQLQGASPLINPTRGGFRHVQNVLLNRTLTQGAENVEQQRNTFLGLSGLFIACYDI